MKPSELIKVLQEAIDAGLDDTTDIMFDTEARTFEYHMAKVGSAYFEVDELGVYGSPYISLHEERY
jgi:hypothetical protein